MTLQSIKTQLSSLPYTSDMVNYTMDASGGIKTPVSFQYEGFLKRLFSSVKSLINRGGPSTLLNSNFNILSTNGTTPVTPIQGSDYEVIKQWFLVNGGGTNDYTITPTAYTTVDTGADASNYYLNVQVPTQDSDLYLYNLNYSLTGQFNSVAQINNKPISFTWSIFNNKPDLAALQFSVYLSTGQEFKSAVAYLKAGFNSTTLTLSPIDLSGISYSSSDFAQIRCYIQQIKSKPIDIDVAYLKAEYSSTGSPLLVNPVLEQFLCTNLT